MNYRSNLRNIHPKDLVDSMAPEDLTNQVLIIVFHNPEARRAYLCD